MSKQFRRRGLPFKHTRRFESWEHQIILKSLKRDEEDAGSLLDVARGLHRLLA